VRAAHGAADVLTGLYAPSMRPRTPAALVVLLLATGALSVAGCGADGSAGDQLPKSTPDLTVPPGADVLVGNARAGRTTSTTSTTSTTGTDTTGAAGTTTAAPAAPSAPSTTSAAPAPAQTQAPSQGAGGTGGTGGGGTGGGGTGGGATGGAGGGTGGGSGDFNEFCDQNPGACPGN
jgi:hypothetical protein